MEAPPVQFVSTRDGYSIAYAVTGKGQPFVFMPQPISHIQNYWTHDTWVLPWLEGLADRFQLIQYDGRGQGLSARGLREDFSMQEATLDLEAVTDGLGIKSFVLMAVQPFGHAAIRYAVEHPQRVEALILMSCAVSLASWSIAILARFGDQDWDGLLRSQAGLSQARDIAASMERQKQAVTESDYRLLIKAAASSDIEDLLPRLQTPTLVLHPRESMNLRPRESMKLAAAIHGARMVLVDGATPLGDHLQGFKAIDDFLASLATDSASPRSDLDVAQVVLRGGTSCAGLSPRQLQVLNLIVRGKTNREIASELVLSLRTVERHVNDIYARLGVRNRTEAVTFALNNLR